MFHTDKFIMTNCVYTVDIKETQLALNFPPRGSVPWDK